MIKKWLVITLLSWLIALWWCNINMKDNNSWNSSTWVKVETSNVSTPNLSNDKVSIIIDKNCENSKVQQCNPTIWKQQFWQILWASWLDISYFDKTNTDSIKKIVPTSPVLVIPADKLSNCISRKWIYSRYYFILFI